MCFVAALGSNQRVVMLAEWLHIDWGHFQSTSDWLFDSGWFFAQQMRKIAFLPATIGSVNCAIFTNAQEQRIDDNLFGKNAVGSVNSEL